VANGIPTTIVASSKDEALARETQDIFMTERFRVYTNQDVIGVELGGSLKNIIAIAAGALDALGFGTNSKAALLTRGLAEIARLGVKMGARRETFYGLSGLGDLTTTCISPYSRNRWLGEEIGKGKRLNQILKETEMVVEGVATAKAAFELSKKYKVEMPITAEIYRVLYENKDPKAAVHDLMTRSPKTEEEY
jgi:glycerol-3-phosphate dehydrogenase (NAD(P)+)